MLMDNAYQFFRKELTELEQYVLISIFDQSWKDHLYAMDMLQGSIGLVGYAERDPRVAFKREGHRFFEEMMENIRAKVTDLIFRARLQGQQKPQQSAYKVKGRDATRDARRLWRRRKRPAIRGRRTASGRGKRRRDQRRAGRRQARLSTKDPRSAGTIRARAAAAESTRSAAA